MEWIKKHTDTVMVLATLFGGFLWLNSQFNELRRDITIIKNVLIMKGIMPGEFVTKGE